MLDFTLQELLAVKFDRLPVALYDAFPPVLFGRALVLSSRLGLFESLSGSPQSIPELSRKLALPAKSVELLVLALESRDYVRKRGDRFTLAPQAQKWLVRSSPFYMGNFLAYTGILHSHWASLEETLLQGKPASTYVERFTEDEWRTYTLAMMELARLIVPHLPTRLSVPPGARTLLDVCGSHGLYAIEMCKRHPDLSAVIADFPEVLKTTRTIVSAHNLQDRITLFPCDVTRTTFGVEQFDVVFAFNIVHGFDADANRKFVSTLASTMKKGGALYILDQLKGGRSMGAELALPLMVGLNLMNEIGGTVYTFEEIRSWCEEMNLTGVRQRRLAIPRVSLVSARKSPR